MVSLPTNRSSQPYMEDDTASPARKCHEGCYPTIQRSQTANGHSTGAMIADKEGATERHRGRNSAACELSGTCSIAFLSPIKSCYDCGRGRYGAVQYFRRTYPLTSI